MSAAAAQAVAFLATLALVPAALEAARDRVADMLRAAVALAAAEAPVPSLDAAELATTVLALVAPILAATAVVAATAHLVQTGGVVATRKLTPKLDALNPVRGAAQLVSPTRLFAVVRALAGGAAVGWLASRALLGHIADLARLPGRPEHAAALASALTRGLLWDAALVGLALGAVDLLVTRRAWLRRLRMTKDEVRREHKESEGDPETKAARERARHELLAAATVGNVKTAAVVIVNPTHLACALRYDESEGDSAPVVVAAGEGDLAAAIVRAAYAYGVPVVRDVPLAQALRELEVGDAIPEALYEAVAEILREVWEQAPPDGEPGQ